jgi:transglutaminase-like putative cysteine protease
MPKFRIHHKTKYSYDKPVRDSANQIVLYPIRDEYQEVLKHELQITGDPEVEVFKDYYGNEIGSFTHAEPHTELIIDSRVEVITHPKPAPTGQDTDDREWAQLQGLRNQTPYIDFLKLEEFSSLQEVRETAHRVRSQSTTVEDAARQLNAYVYGQFKYIKGITSVETTLDEVWMLRAGVCQDFAHVLLIMLRLIQLPARYVSGYICPNSGPMRGEGATHAWVETYLPSYGWIGMDPTNNCLVNGMHVRLAVGRSFSDCSPVRGTYKGSAEHQLEVGVSVIYEDGRTVNEASAILKPQPVKPVPEQNSYRKYLEMMQQQQQQQ